MNSRVPKNTYKCHGMKNASFAKNGTQYRIAKMQRVYDNSFGDIEKFMIFNTEKLRERSYKDKYFMFSRVNRPSNSIPSVSLNAKFEVYDALELLPAQDITSDDEYM